MKFRLIPFSQFFFVFVCLLTACSTKKKADLLILNAKVYTVDSLFSVVEAIAVKDGKVEAVGTSAFLQQQYETDSVLDAKGAFVYPGFIDAHAHFYRYGLGLRECNLTGTNSWEDVLQRLQDFVRERNPQKGEWIIGRGWDQNDWVKKDFPLNTLLNEYFPDNPVLLTRIDGHAAIANDLALSRGGVTATTRLTGGDVLLQNGRPTGVLVDNAIDLVSKVIPPPSEQQVQEALLAAQRNCYAVGLTTIDDCGLDYEQVLQIERMQKAGTLTMRLYVMLSDAPQNYESLSKRGIIKTPYLHVRSFKVYGDGALGSRGACLLQPYSDRPDYYGFLLSSPAHFDSVARFLYEKKWQMCTHAIGDSGNRTILNIYGKYLNEKNDLRWRIEHAQVVHAEDVRLFGRFSIIPSVQPTHATSDMYWAEMRLGKQRIKEAYAYNELLQQNGWLPLGTDFPIESIDPIKTFCAAVFRQDEKEYPAGGFQMENALDRQAALRGMTVWAAKANFEENEKGSIEKGKFADFVVLNTDLMHASFQEIRNAKVMFTISAGQKRYSRN